MENYYIINSKYINKLKELLKHDDIHSKNKSNINDSLKNIDTNLIKKELLIKEYFEIQKIPFKIEEKLEIKYYLNFVLISKDLNDILIKNELISDKQEIIEIECLFNDNKILIHSLSQNDNCIFIYSKNKEKREFIIESLIYIEEKEKINHYINYLKQKGINIYLKELNLKDNKCDILDENKNKIGLFYQLINNNIKNDKVDNNIKIREEILILIKIYLYNKNLYEKIIASKNLDNSIFNQKNYNDKCYLINQEYITKYKEHYSYDKIKKYLDDNINTIDKDDINNIYEKMAKEEFFKDIEKKEKLGIKNIKKEGIDFIDVKNKIKYKNNFIIVNEEIYKLIIKNIDNNDENAEYIINNGKIFIFVKEFENYQLIIHELIDINNKTFDNNFNLCILIKFNNSKDLDEFKDNILNINFLIFTQNLSKAENKLFLLKENSEKKEIGEIYEINKTDIYNQIKDEKGNFVVKNLILLGEICINFEKIKIQINSGNINNKEEYYIINSEFIKCLNQSYDYDGIVKKLKENEKFKKYVKELEIKSNLDNSELIQQIFVDIFNNNQQSFIKINNPGKIDVPQNSEIYKMIQELKLQNNIGISFLNKFSIINSKIKEIFQNIFNLESEDKYMIPINCLKDKNDIYIFYKLKETFLMNVGNFDTNLIYDTKILLEIDNKEYFKDIINKGINNEIESVITSLIKYYKDCIIIEDINKNKKGIAYKINIKLPNPESNMRTLFDSCNKQKDKNLNQNSNNNINNIFVNNNYLGYSNNQNNNMTQNQKNVINPLLEKDIKIIIKYILFHSKLEKYLNASKNKGFYKIIHNCYLINHAWMQTYQFYLFYND